MKIVTNKLAFNTPFTYYDINAAGPTLYAHLFDDDHLLKVENKQQRNVLFGKKIKEKGVSRYLPFILYSFSKLICYEMDGIIYTQDSVVINKNINDSIFAKNSIFTFKKSWISKLLVIHKNKKSYFAICENNKIIIKGDDLPLGILKHLYLFFNEYKQWMYYFKLWFLNAEPVMFVTNKQKLYLKNNVIINNVNTMEPKILQYYKSKINYDFYWLKILPYIQSIYLFIEQKYKSK